MVSMVEGDVTRSLSDVVVKLERLSRLLEERLSVPPVQEFYFVETFAKLVNRSVDRVRVWCWQRRVLAEKADTGAGPHFRWIISHAEYERYLREGLRKPTLA